MRANEIIRGILDLIDGIDSGENQPAVSISIDKQPIQAEPVAVIAEPEQEYEHDDVRRFKQIVDILDSPTDGTMSPFSNAPNEVVADIESVTTAAGGGVNNPKHPSDQRVQHPSLYPAHQDGAK